MRKEEFDNKEYDCLIKENVKALIDHLPPVHVEEKWQEFENRLQAEQQKETNKQISLFRKYQRMFVPVAVFAVVFIIFISLSPKTVIGFKNEVFRWFGQTESGDVVISERHNPEYKQGIFKDLSWEEAKGMVVFALKSPQYVPADFQSPPLINVVSNEYPQSVVVITYVEEDKRLIIKQENILNETNRNTFVPQNADIQKIRVNDNLEVTLINQESTVQVFWTENMIRFNIMTQNIAVEEIIKVIEALK
ncbi:MAG: DUF4367 domain-containing protein [Clostridia bacterium]|nr:DUF4367 domain-containing protein [Clostridia bacterium]